MKNIDLNNKTILVTGGAGFIGSNLIKRLFNNTKGSTIINIDNLNDYYDVHLKEYRLKELETLNGQLSTVNYQFVKGDLADKNLIDKLFAEHKFDVVVNLAAQAGVRYSITNPDAYIQSNMIGFYNILEACRHSRDAVKGQKSKDEGQPQTSDLRPMLVWNTWSMPAAVLCMAATRRCHSRRMTVWIILCHCMRLRRRAMSCLPIATVSCMIYQPRVCASLQYMVQQDVLIWRTSVSPTNC